MLGEIYRTGRNRLSRKKDLVGRVKKTAPTQPVQYSPRRQPVAPICHDDEISEALITGDIVRIYRAASNLSYDQHYGNIVGLAQDLMNITPGYSRILHDLAFSFNDAMVHQTLGAFLLAYSKKDCPVACARAVSVTESVLQSSMDRDTKYLAALAQEVLIETKRDYGMTNKASIHLKLQAFRNPSLYQLLRGK
jgi:hypothetical protein